MSETIDTLRADNDSLQLKLVALDNTITNALADLHTALASTDTPRELTRQDAIGRAIILLQGARERSERFAKMGGVE